MGNLTAVLIMIPGLTLLGGCAPDHLAMTPYPSQVNPALLFDSSPGSPAAGEMAVRSDWPSALSFYQFGESVYYRERSVDLQMIGPQGRGPLGYTYRRFDTFREGGGVR